MGERALLGERFVGRANELRELLETCRSATTPPGSLVVVSGEEGIGKTRLCRELSVRARQEGIVVLMARCCGEGSPAMWPWQPILDELCGPEAFRLLAGDAGVPAGVERDRYIRFEAVTEKIAAASRAQPTCIVVDDIHAADAGTLLLLRFVVRSLHRLPLALVLTRRPLLPGGDRVEGRLVEEIEREGNLLRLRGLGPSETAELLATHGVHADQEMLAMISRVTRGHPLFLRRLAALGGTAAGPEAEPPAGLRAVIDHAVGELKPEHQRLLRTAALLGLTPSVIEVAAVTRTDVVVVLELFRAAEASGLTAAEAPGRFVFSHDLVRTALVDGLSPADRLDGHARAARAIDDAPGGDTADNLIRRAHHTLAAAPRSVDDAQRAVEACRRAARSLIRSFAYEQADSLLSAAVEVHEPGLGEPGGPLLLEWAQGALLCGLPAEARRRFARALAVAENERDPVMLAEALMGMGGYWLTEAREPVERARLLGMQRTTLAALPPSETSLRCRLAARLAADALYNGGPVEPMYEALEAVSRCGDQAALADALSFCHHALMHPEHTRSRLALADELVQVAAESGHGLLGLMGLCWRTLDLLDLGDPRAARALEDLRQRADALRCQAIMYEVGVIDVMLTIRAGRLAEAEAMAEACYERGQEVGEVDALFFYGAQVGVIRWVQGRTDELIELMDGIASSPQLHEADFAFRASGAVFVYDAGDRVAARQILADLTTTGLRALPRSSTWLVGMMAITELAARFGDQEVVREAYELLHPFADLPMVPSLGVACFGSTHRALGTAALAFGDAARAVDHFGQAVAANRRIGNLPLAAIAQAQLALAILASRSDARHRDDAAGLLADSIERAESMGMTARAATWREQLATQTSETPAPQPVAVDAAAVPPRQVTHPTGGGVRAPRRYGTIRREGAGWSLAVDDRHVHVGRLVGVRYLAELVAHPGQAIPAVVLAGHGRAAGSLSHQEMLDHEARAAYVERVHDLTEDLREAESHADTGHAERLRIELEALVDHLSTATGLVGRTRAFAGPDERARTAVRKAIMRAVEAIDTADRSIGSVLRSSITTGRACVYHPDPDQPITWSVENR